MSILELWLKNNRATINEIKYIINRFKSNKLSLVGLFITLVFVMIAFFAPLISPYDPIEMNYDERLSPPSSKHWFGTDEHGRDMFSRVLNGANISLSIGVMVIGISSIIGIVIGAIAGYFGGKIDTLFMRITDIFLAFPSLILSMAVAAALGRSLTNMMLAISFVQWSTYARIMRGQTLSVKEELFVESSRAIGSSKIHIILQHIIPNCLSPTIIQASLSFGGIIMSAAGLSFIGFGARPPTPEWGLLISEGRRYLINQWWLVMCPGLAIFITVLGFNLLGDGIRDIMDPRMRGR